MYNNKTKTILFASLIVAMVLPFSMVDFAAADPDYNLKTDLELIKEAEKIMETERNFDYDADGNNEKGIQNEDQRQHQLIIKELNERGMFHETQERDRSLAGYEVVKITTTTNTNNLIEVGIYSPIASNIETNDSVCTTCGQTHNKKLAIKSGIEWPNSHWSWIIHREESKWSPYVGTVGTKFATSQFSGNENNVKMYFHTKSDHAVTTASYSVNSLIMVKDQNSNWISLEDATSKSYASVYYPYKFTIKGDDLQTESYLSGATKHITTLDIYAIS